MGGMGSPEVGGSDIASPNVSISPVITLRPPISSVKISTL